MERYKNAIVLHPLSFSWIKPLILVGTSTSFASIVKIDWQLYFKIFRFSHSSETEFLEWFGRLMVKGYFVKLFPMITNHNVTGEMDISFRKDHTLSLITLFCFLLFAGIVFTARVSVFLPWCLVCSWAAIWGEPLQGESQGFVLARFTRMLDSHAED